MLSKFGCDSVCAVLTSNAGVCFPNSDAAACMLSWLQTQSYAVLIQVRETTHQERGHPVAVQKRRKPGTPVGFPKMIITAIPVHNEVRYI